MNDIYDNLTKEQLIGLQKQIRWERDVAIEQLHQIGKEFGEKMDDVHKVVFCKDCKYGHVYKWEGKYHCELNLHFEIVGKDLKGNTTYNSNSEWGADDFCSKGERK